MADATYAIEIAASMPGGDATIAQLDELTATLLGGGKDAAFFSEAIVGVSKSLDGAKAASAAAAGELASAKREFAGLEREAVKAAEAAEKHAQSADAVAGRVDKAKAAVLAQSDALDKARAASLAATATAEAYAQSANVDADALARLRIAEIQAAAAVDTKTRALSVAERQVTTAEKAVDSFATKQTYLANQATAAKAAVDAASAGIAGLEKASTSASAAEQKHADTLKNLQKLQGHTNKTLASQAEKLEKVAAAATQLGGPVGGLIAMPIMAAKSFAALSAAVGKSRATMLAAAVVTFGLVAGLALVATAGVGAAIALTVGVVKLADRFHRLDAIEVRFKKNLKGLFKDVNIDPVVRGLSRLTSWFDKSTGDGKAMRFLLGGIFEPLIKGFEVVTYYIEAFALGFQIGLLKAYLVAKPAIKRIRGLLGFDDLTSPKVLGVIADSAELMAYGFIAAAAAAAILVGAIALVVAAPSAIMYAFGYVFDKITDGIAWVIEKFVAFKNFVVAVPWADIGLNMMRGVVEGIKSGAVWVWDAVTNVFDGAITKAKKALGIASPSRVMGEIGDNTVEGYTRAVDKKAPEAQAATANAVEPPPVTANLAPSGASGPSSSFSFAGAIFNFYGVAGAEGARESFAEAMTKLLEGDASALAGSEAPA